MKYFYQIVAAVLCAGLLGCGDPSLERYNFSSSNSGEQMVVPLEQDEFEALIDEILAPFSDPYEGEELVIAEWTQVLDYEVVDRLIEMDDERLVFSLEDNNSLLKIEPMDVLVSAHPEKPFLRRSLYASINEDENTITFHTVQATLEDIALHGSFSLDDADILAEPPDLQNPPSLSTEFRQLRQAQSSSGQDPTLGDLNNIRAKLGEVKEIKVSDTDSKNFFNFKFDPKAKNVKLNGRSKFDISFKSMPGMCTELNKITNFAGGESSEGTPTRAALLAWTLKYAGHWAPSYFHSSVYPYSRREHRTKHWITRQFLTYDYFWNTTWNLRRGGAETREISSTQEAVCNATEVRWKSDRTAIPLNMRTRGWGVSDPSRWNSFQDNSCSSRGKSYWIMNPGGVLRNGAHQLTGGKLPAPPDCNPTLMDTYLPEPACQERIIECHAQYCEPCDDGCEVCLCQESRDDCVQRWMEEDVDNQGLVRCKAETEECQDEWDKYWTRLTELEANDMCNQDFLDYWRETDEATKKIEASLDSASGATGYPSQILFMQQREFVKAEQWFRRYVMNGERRRHGYEHNYVFEWPLSDRDPGEIWKTGLDERNISTRRDEFYRAQDKGIYVRPAAEAMRDPFFQNHLTRDALIEEIGTITTDYIAGGPRAREYCEDYRQQTADRYLAMGSECSTSLAGYQEGGTPRPKICSFLEKSVKDKSGFTNDCLKSLREDALKERDLLRTLEDTPAYDDLSWVTMAPIVAKSYCQGQVESSRIGTGAQLTLDWEAQLKLESKHKEQTTREVQENGSPVRKVTRWEHTFASKGFWFWFGIVPVHFGFKVQWLTTAEAAFNVVMEQFAVGPKDRKAELDFYFGIAWGDGKGLRTETLKDIHPDKKENTLDFGFETARTSSGTIDWGETIKKNLFPDPLSSKFEAKLSAELATGPALSFLLYDSLGIQGAAQLYAKASVGGGVQVGTSLPNIIKPSCSVSADAGAKVTLQPIVKLPFSSKQLKIDNTTLFDSCKPRLDAPWCLSLADAVENFIPVCAGPSNTTRATPGQTASPGAFMSSPPRVDYPEGVNDVPGHYELDALWLERDGQKILPVEVFGLTNCDEVAAKYPDKFTRDRGCPELLWYADFETCDPEGWADKVGLIADFNEFAVRFYDDAQPGDSVHLIRQAVPANRINENGERCQASGSMDVYIGAMDQHGEFWSGDPVATHIYNSSNYRVEREHLQAPYMSMQKSYWQCDIENCGDDEFVERYGEFLNQ